MKSAKKARLEQTTSVREVIASGTVTRLDRCACGDLYLTVGPITIALHPDALADLCTTLGQGLARIDARVRDAVGQWSAVERPGQNAAEVAQAGAGEDGTPPAGPADEIN